MTFLSIDSQKSLFTIQKSQLQFEQTLVMNQANWVTKEMSYISQDYSKNNDGNNNSGDTGLEDDPVYIALQQQEEYLTARQKALDSQISLIDSELSSMKSLVTNNIKSSCTLNLIGG